MVDAGCGRRPLCRSMSSAGASAPEDLEDQTILAVEGARLGDPESAWVRGRD